MFYRTLSRALPLCAVLLAGGCEDEGPHADSDPSGADDASADAGRDGGATDARAGDAADIDSSSRDATVDARSSEPTPDAQVGSNTDPRDASTAAPDAASLDGSVSDAGLDAAPVDASVDATADASAPDARVEAGPADAQADGAPTDGGDASSDSGPDPVCIDEGENCDRGSCCGGLACVPEGDTGRYVCGAACAIRAMGCEPGCGPYCGAASTGPYRCNRAVVLGHDGTYLGLAASSSTADDSVCSSVDPYGTGQIPNSIYNEVGRFGNSTSPLSAFNQYASTPPAVVCIDDHAVIARVTKSRNQALNPVDPEQLCDWLRGRQM